jgi:hypothetical protein
MNWIGITAMKLATAWKFFFESVRRFIGATRWLMR